MIDPLDETFYGRGGPGQVVGQLDVSTAAALAPTSGTDTDSKAWIETLGAELTRRATIYERSDAYYRGEHGLRFIKTRFRADFGKTFENYRENFCSVVIDSVDQRLDVDGFRFPAAAGDNPAATDPDAWRIWQDNGLDARSQVAHTEALVKGLVYVLVSPFNEERVAGGRSPRITIEDPCQVIVANTPGSSERIVGMKRWSDELAAMTFATLYFPDRIEKWQATAVRWANQFGSGVTGKVNWEPRRVAGEAWPLPNPLGVVPIVPLVNRPRLGLGMFSAIEGRSEIADVIPIQDAINTIALNGLVASDKAAFRQKWGTGIEILNDPDTGKPIAPWKPDIETILTAKSPDAKFGNFEATDLEQYDRAIVGKLLEIAGITQTPMRYFVQQTGQPASGEAMDASEVGLNKKAERKQRQFGEGWEEVQRLAFRQLGETKRADDTACEAVWRPAANEPAASKIDALTKEVQTLRIPLDVAWERAGYSATQRALFPEMLARQAAWLGPLIASLQPVVPDKTPPIAGVEAPAGPAAAATSRTIRITRPDGSVVTAVEGPTE